jgi:hypothetical protein
MVVQAIQAVQPLRSTPSKKRAPAAIPAAQTDVPVILPPGLSQHNRVNGGPRAQ